MLPLVKLKTVICLIALYASTMAQEQITFPSLDGLDVTANLYQVNESKSTPFIVLFHQAGWSRGEYLEIAPKLNDLGFNVMAVDQRSGDAVNDVKNETHKRAVNAELGINFPDALPDMEAALVHARATYADATLLAWGSSYSAALVLKLAGDKPELLDGALAFSPGEYFARFGKPSTWIQDSAAGISDPIFVTSAKNEQSGWQAMFDAVLSDKTFFIPETSGNHGSRALWAEFSDNDVYWNAVTEFLGQFQ